MVELLEDYKDFFIIIPFSLAVSCLWFGIHFALKWREKRGKELSDLAKQWRDVSKIAGYAFIVFPFIMILLLPLFEKALGLLFVVIVILIFLRSFIKKGKI